MSSKDFKSAAAAAPVAPAAAPAEVKYDAKAQAIALKLMQDGHSLVLHGPGGTGKTYILNKFITSIDHANEKARQQYAGPQVVSVRYMHGAPPEPLYTRAVIDPTEILVYHDGICTDYSLGQYFNVPAKQIIICVNSSASLDMSDVKRRFVGIVCFDVPHSRGLSD